VNAVKDAENVGRAAMPVTTLTLVRSSGVTVHRERTRPPDFTIECAMGTYRGSDIMADLAELQIIRPLSAAAVAVLIKDLVKAERRRLRRRCREGITTAKRREPRCD
jgi:hypothetical protein